MNFQNSGKLLASAKHQPRLLEFANSEKNYMTFSIFLDDAYLDYAILFPKNTAKFNDVAKMLDVSPAECQSALAFNGELDSESEL